MLTMRAAAPSVARRRVRGMSLTEVLVSMAIFAIGVLGLFSTHATAFNTYSDAKHRVDAALLADRLISEMWVDRANAAAQQSAQAQEASSGLGGVLNDFLFGSTGPRGGKKDGLLQSVAKSQARSIANKAAGQLLRGVLGSLLGGKK